MRQHRCASARGSFLNHMAERLNYGTIEEFARVALEAESPAILSGRCAVERYLARSAPQSYADDIDTVFEIGGQDSKYTLGSDTVKRSFCETTTA